MGQNFKNLSFQKGKIKTKYLNLKLEFWLLNLIFFKYWRYQRGDNIYHKIPLVDGISSDIILFASLIARAKALNTASIL